MAASVVLHAGVLGGLVMLQRSTTRPIDEAPISVTFAVLDPDARVGAGAGISWETEAGRAALTALLAARREVALLGELVITQTPRRPISRREAGPLAAPPVRVAVRPVPAPADPSETALAEPVDRRTETLVASAEPTPPVERAVRKSGPAAPSKPAASPVEVAASAPALAGSAPAARTAQEPPDRSYLDAVFERLKPFRDYPGLGRYHTSGRVLLAVTVGRDGTVLSADIRRSSGYSFLDQAGLDMIHRASPLPALPATPPRDSLAILIPINFWYE